NRQKRGFTIAGLTVWCSVTDDAFQCLLQALRTDGNGNAVLPIAHGSARKQPGFGRHAAPDGEAGNRESPLLAVTPSHFEAGFFFAASSFAFAAAHPLLGAAAQTRRFLNDTDPPATVRRRYAFSTLMPSCSPNAVSLPSSVAAISLPCISTT